MSIDCALQRLLDGQWAEAVPIFKDLHEQYPMDPGLLHNLAVCHEMLGDIEEATDVYRNNIARHPYYHRSALGLYNCARMRDVNERTDERTALVLARARYEALLAALNAWRAAGIPDPTQALLLLSEALFSVGLKDYNDAAIALFVQAVEQTSATETRHYAQCYYENYVGREYFMLHPPRLPLELDEIASRPSENGREKRTPAFVVVLVASAGYKRMLRNCLASMPPSLSRHALVVCLDREVQADVQSYHRLSAVVLPGNAPRFPEVALYNQPAFNQIVHVKMAVVHRLLSSGSRVLCCDLDVAWRSDRAMRWLAEAEAEAEACHIDSRVSSPKLLFQRDTFDRACTGLFYACPGAGEHAREMADIFDIRHFPPDCGDQPVVNWWLRHRYQGQWGYLPSDLFPNGEDHRRRKCEPDYDPVAVHYNNMLSIDKPAAMRASGDWHLPEPDSPQERIWLDTEPYRLAPHTNSGYSGPWIEQAYAAHWRKTNRTNPEPHCTNPEPHCMYLPIYWTELMLQDRNKYDAALRYVSGLPQQPYYTVVQHGDGVRLPDNVKVFASGRPLEGQVCIPLLKEDLTCSPASKPVLISFNGTVTLNNDPKGIRTRMLEATKGDVLVYTGPKWKEVLRDSVFVLCPRGFGPTSFRLGEAIQCEAIPIIIWEDELCLPYRDELDWESFSVLVHASEVDQILGRVRVLDVGSMRQKVRGVKHLFTYEHVCSYIDCGFANICAQTCGT